MDELISQLNEARKQIKEKDADIAWTAQIAQDLMSQKDILSKQLESLKLENEEILMNQNNRQRDSDSLYISNLEDQFQELQLENEALKKTNASTIDALKTMEKDSRDSLKLYESSKFIVSDLESKVNKLEMKQESLLNEKNNLQIILDNHTSSSISKEGLSKLAHELTESNTTLQLENQQMKQDVEKYMITNDELGMKCTELESMLQEYQDTQEKLRDSENLAQELSTDLEILKNYSESLKQRLSLLEPESGILPTKCSRTLLDEYISLIQS